MKITLLVLAAFIALLFMVYAWYGGFKKVQISKRIEGGETLVYEKIIGDYRQSGVVMDKIYYALLNDYKVKTYKGFGLYFDNPQKVEKEKLRSEAGCIVENANQELLDKLIGKFELKTAEKKEYLVAEFPYKNKMSVMFSIMKVYPALNKFARENGLDEDTPVMEIYDIPNKKILYRKEIGIQKD